MATSMVQVKKTCPEIFIIQGGFHHTNMTALVSSSSPPAPPLSHLKTPKSLTQKKDKPSSKDVVCTAALTRKHEPKGERKLLTSGEMTPSPRTPVDALVVGIAFRISSFICCQSRGLEQHRKKGHLGICCHHGSTGTATPHQKHLYSQLCCPPFNNSQHNFCLQAVCHLVITEERKALP